MILGKGTVDIISSGCYCGLACMDAYNFFLDRSQVSFGSQLVKRERDRKKQLRLNKTTGCCLGPLSAVTARTRRLSATGPGSFPPVHLPITTEPLRDDPDSPESLKIISLLHSLFDSPSLNLHCHLCFFPDCLLLCPCPLVPFWFCQSEVSLLRASWRTSVSCHLLLNCQWMRCH